MIISTWKIKLFGLWLLALSLLTTNLSYFLTQRSAKANYSQSISKLLAEQSASRLALQAEISQLQLRHNQLTALTSEQKEAIKVLNSGTNVDQVTVQKGDCSTYEKPWRKFTDSQTCSFILSKAVGDLKMLIVEFAEPDLDLNDSKIKTYIDRLNSSQDRVFYGEGGAARNQTTLQYIKTYFESEAKRFNAQFTLKIDRLPVVQFSESSNSNYSWKRENVGKNEAFFLNQLIKAKIDVRDYDAIAILVFGKQNFRSFALPGIRAHVTSISPNIWDMEYDVSVVAHETAHDFGTRDQYIEEVFGGCVEGTNDEYLAGDQYSLMCKTGTINLESRFASVINGMAAKDMGWLK